jgi:hypothetical protein
MLLCVLTELKYDRREAELGRKRRGGLLRPLKLGNVNRGDTGLGGHAGEGLGALLTGCRERRIRIGRRDRLALPVSHQHYSCRLPAAYGAEQNQ